ncbi:HXXEE domain-containing protein [Propionibacteriaceae bacterium Y1700]|uniref:HXXEE domain-containing protein n=1 Tax=Microlunatus sp. Y1700 TaxID=3418487 RepID=UPI003DA76190
MTSIVEQRTESSAARERTGSRLTMLWLATALAVMLHNAEEWWFGLTTWMAERPWLPGHAVHGDARTFDVVLAIVTCAVLALALTAIVLRPRWSAGVLIWVSWGLVINGLGHLVLAAIALSPMPGVVSGVGLLVPLGLVSLRQLKGE